MEIFGEYDVVVIGGGTAGTIAAIASARSGANTLLVERYGFVGGTSTGGRINFYNSFHNLKGERVVGGIAQEVVNRLLKMGATPGSLRDYTGLTGSCTLFNCEILQLILFEMLEESGVDILLHSVAIGTFVQSNKMRGIKIVNKSGVQVIIGKVFIDTTGDGDVAALVGVPFEKTNKELMQPVTLEFRVGGVDASKVKDYIQKHPDQFELSVDPQEVGNQQYFVHWLGLFPPLKEAVVKNQLPPDLTYKQIWFNTFEPDMQRGIFTINATRVKEIDGTDAKDLTYAEIKARRQIIPLINFFRRNFPGFENSYLLDIAPNIGIRETRRIIGEYMITRDDVLSGKKHRDVIARGVPQIDIHGSTINKEKFFWIKSKDLKISSFDIPYRSLVPKKVDGLLVAGRCISATREAHGAVRLMPVCMATGQAAGTAAALAARKNILPRELSFKELQIVLRQNGALLD